MWWLYIAVPLGVIIAIVLVLRRRGTAGGEPGDSPYGVDTATGPHTARELGRGSWG